MHEAVGRIFDVIPEGKKSIRVSEWATQHRILPAALTPRPGAFDWNITPYLKEIADCLSESSDVCEVAVMKGARIGFTVGVIENHLGYMIDTCPGPAMFLSANKEMAQTSVELRVDRMIETSGLQGKIFSQSIKRANKKTGDSKSKKEFPGGFLLIGGPSGPFLRGTGARYLYLDEIDEWKLQVGGADKKKTTTANQGDPVELVRKRATTDYPLNRKLIFGSTPLDEDTSKIKELFETGDQCYYYVPCPKCGTMQRLIWRDEQREGPDQYRMKYALDARGLLVPGSVYYECENKECRAHWTNDDKLTLLPGGEWRATAVPTVPLRRSFHISSLYSPLGMHTWDEVCREWIMAQGDLGKLRTFVNTTLGETWKERGVAPSADKAAKRAGGYVKGTLPTAAKPLIATAGADIQANRIAVEVVAWGAGKESWSILYEELPGVTNEIYGVESAFPALKKILDATYAGLPVIRTLIDCRFNDEAVRRFCEENYSDFVRPVMGYEDIGGLGGAKQYYALRETSGWTRKRVDLNSSALKIEVFNCIARGTKDGLPPDEPFPGYCHFPSDYERHFFHMLTAEDFVAKRDPRGKVQMAWVKHGRNEALDCRTYAMGCLYVMYGERVKEIAEEDKAGGWEPREYTWKDFWDELQALKNGLA